MNEVVEYLYEKIRGMMMPVTEIPATLGVFVAPLATYRRPMVEASLAFDRTEFRKLIGLLVGFERYGTDPKMRTSLNPDSSISRVGTQPGVIRRHDVDRSILCKKYTRMCELHDFLHLIDTDYIAYVNIRCCRRSSDENYNGVYGVTDIEFSVAIGGFDIVNSNGKVMNSIEMSLFAVRWGKICSDCNYFSDFSRLVGAPDMNAIIFMMDYVRKG